MAARLRWTHPVEVVPRVYSLRAFGCQVFALLDEDVTLIDAGAPGSTRLIARQLEELGYGLADVSRIILTHFHWDHAAAVAEIARASGAEVFVHEAEAAFLRGDEPYRSPFANRALASLSGWAYRLAMPAPIPVTSLAQDDVIPALGGIRIHHAPGHTRGSIVMQLQEQGIIFTGDVFQSRRSNPIGPSWVYTEDRTQAEESIRRIAEIDFNTICYSHFPPLLNARPMVKALASRLTRT